MPMTVDQITIEALALPSNDRADLADQLVESLDPADDQAFSALWAAEAKRRLDEMRNGVNTIPGGEALRSVREALGL